MGLERGLETKHLKRHTGARISCRGYLPAWPPHQRAPQPCVRPGPPPSRSSSPAWPAWPRPPPSHPSRRAASGCAARAAS
eukprot:scaffold91199_cov51-Phaeocystis_antarctica.AAC.1